MGLGDAGGNTRLVEDAVGAAAALPEAATLPSAAFVRAFLAGVDQRDLARRSPAAWARTAMVAAAAAAVRAPGATVVRVTEAPGATAPRTVVDVVVDDMPFLVDSVTMEVSRQGLAIHQVVHPLLRVTRRGDDLVDVERRGFQAGAPRADQRDEALIHLEIDTVGDEADRRDLAAGIAEVVDDVRVAVEDYPRMRARLDELVDELTAPRPDVDDAHLAEVRRFLRWLDDDHFTFLGFQRYRFTGSGADDPAVVEAGSGLGILRDGADRATALGALPGGGRPATLEQGALFLTKADARSRVHRPVYLDHVAVTTRGTDGALTGLWRFLGLYTSRVYSGSVREIPVVRHKIEKVVARADFAADSHAAKELIAILEEYPRDELFEISVDDLDGLAHRLLGLQERREVRLFVRPERFGRYVSCLMFVPRDRYDTATRQRLQAVLADTFDVQDIDHEVHISASVLARVHFVVRLAAGTTPDVDVAELERRLAAATRIWSDDLQAALEARHGPDEAARLALRHRSTFPASYREGHDAREAVDDLAVLDRLELGGGLGMRLHWRGRNGQLPRFKVFCAGEAIPLSRMLPMLEHMGFEVVDRQPHVLTPAGDGPAWLYEFQLRIDLPGALDHEGAGALFQEAFARAWVGDAEDDGLNRLVVWARLGWRDVEVLRAYLRYVRQTDSRYSQAYMEDALVCHPEITRRLVAVFHARFDPDHHDQTAADELAAEIEGLLEDVPSLDEDRILRSLLATVLATVRTSAFQHRDGERAGYLVLKFDPALVPDLPRPRPAHEVFVYAVRTEGIHLRGGAVARGGIRWSDRREDFRTEVLGLAKAQSIKNAVIVPVGAKGAFVLKQLPAGADRDAVSGEVAACYRIFIRGLLAVTDNLVDGTPVPPDRVVRYDGDDPYLVVAADRGTATFSDTANQLAEERGFWLGDAFASGGSAGYDHKAMGITARGVWESVRRHFRELGVDVQRESVDVVGIGDLSGDVFGNGMLRSDRLRLVAAFDHRHVFLDPDPDPAVSFAERQRLYDLPRSSWDDYDRGRISEGGGVWPRTAKSVPLAPAVRERLGIEEGELTPEDLIAAILRAPVDLLYNGGVGTFVKASDERHLDVGDRVNDRIRVDGAQVRAKVVAEGGNLGFTQRARVEYARAGGRINIDAIDNSGGVDCSDREVNIKILLAEPLAAGELTREERDTLLAEMTDEVAALVLAGNADQALALSSSVTNARPMAGVLRRYLVALEQAGHLDRTLEGLPSDEELAERQAGGEALVRPELAVLLSTTKTVLAGELLASDLPDDPWTEAELAEYFPAPLPTRFPAAMRNHRLRRELVATRFATQVVNEAGITFVFRLQQETGATTSEIVRAQLIARAVFGLEALQADVRALDDLVRSDVQTDLLLEGRRLVERTSRWLLRNVARPAALAPTIERFTPGVAELATLLPEIVRGMRRTQAHERQDQLHERGVPAELAARVTAYPVLASALDLVQIGERTTEPLHQVAGVSVELDRQLELDWLRKRIDALARDRRWDALARDALREDFAAQHAAMTTAALTATDAAAAPRQRVSDWLVGHEVEVQRCHQVLREVRGSSAADLALLSVALRELRNLIHAAS